MSYKNSIKLLTSNFTIVWKQLCYLLIISIILFGIGYGVATPTLNLLESKGVIEEISAIFSKIYTEPKELITTMSSTFLHFANVISTNFDKIWLSVLATTIVFLVLTSLLIDISIYNISSLMHIKMTSFVDMGYTRNMISTLAQSIRFASAKLILKIPFAFSKLIVLYTYFKIINGPLTVFIGLFVTVLFIVLISSVEILLFAGMAPKMLDYNGNYSAIKAFFMGLKNISKNFTRAFSTSIIVVLTVILINSFLGLFTVGVALLITIPATMIFIAIYQLTSYFTAKGERYYLSESIIANPHKNNEETIKN